MPDEDAVWRVGHVEAPLAFKPPDYRSWDHRYDDERREFGSLYCAVNPVTALREVLQELRPNAKARAEFIELFGDDDELPKTAVTWSWRSHHMLMPATISVSIDEFVDLISAAVRAQVERDHADVLADHGVAHLDITDATSRVRSFTQALARAFFDVGAAGVRFASNIDGEPCFALFEGRAELYARTDGDTARLLTDDVPELLQVCDEWELPLEPRP